MLGFRHFLPEPRQALAAVAAQRLVAGIDPAPPSLEQVPSAPAGDLPLAQSEITGAALYEALSMPAGDLVANGRVSKFLVDLRDPADPRVLFINGNFLRDGVVPDEAKFHYDFARAVLNIPEQLSEFNRLTYFSPTKLYAAGVLHTYQLAGDAEPIYGLQFYPQDVVSEQGVVDIVTLVKAKISIPGARFAFVATGSQQTVATVLDQLTAAGIEALTVDRILGSITYLPLNAGEAWGYLRIFPAADSLTPADIPVFDELPLDLSVVAGVITKAVQDSNSHVNLKSKERGTPNMVLRDAGPEQPAAGSLSGTSRCISSSDRVISPSNRPPPTRWPAGSPSGTTNPGSH